MALQLTPKEKVEHAERCNSPRLAFLALNHSRKSKPQAAF
jgi:hypothetical protein